MARLANCTRCNGDGFYPCKSCRKGRVGGFLGFGSKTCPDCYGIRAATCRSCNGIGGRTGGETVALDLVENAKDGSQLVLILAGGFLVGEPTFEVHLDAYYISVTAVTNAQYTKFVEATRHREPVDQSTGFTRYRDPWLANHPVVLVSWEDAKSYCEWAGLRLPTELEWEKASRGSGGQTYPWGNEWVPANCRNERNKDTEEKRSFTAAVRSYGEGESPYGLLGMAGNVDEWCADAFEEDAYERYRHGDLTPPATGRGGPYVTRGGSFNDSGPRDFICSRRDSASRASLWRGFRTAKNAL